MTAHSDHSFARFQEILRRETGIVIEDSKRYLVESRLARLIADERLSGLDGVVKKMTGPGGNAFKARVIDMMTTNETLWFRDSYPFRALESVIFPELDAARRRLRVWSAACSSGQEPYSIAMAARRYQGRQGRVGCDPNILATDISDAMLEKARRGIYDEFSISRGLGPELRDAFFERQPEGWQIADSIRRSVNFRKHNLLEPFSALGRFDVIFLRNVLIYFSQEVRNDILRRLVRQLAPGGFLVLGASESLGAVSDQFELVRVPGGGIIYRLKAG